MGAFKTDVLEILFRRWLYIYNNALIQNYDVEDAPVKMIRLGDDSFKIRCT